MKIENQRINIKAVKNYQTVEMEMVISDFTDEEYHQAKEYLVSEAMKTVKLLARDIEADSKSEVPSNTNFQRSSSYRNPTPPANAPKYGSAPKNTHSTSRYPGSGRSTSPSEAQVNMLKRLGYTDDQLEVMTKSEATEIIRQYQVQTGYQHDRDYDMPDYNNY